jgi:hypothetical protein
VRVQKFDPPRRVALTKQAALEPNEKKPSPAREAIRE